MNNKEPTFRLDIKACHYSKLTMEQLTKKLTHMRAMGLTSFYTIREDTGEEIETKTETKTE